MIRINNSYDAMQIMRYRETIDSNKLSVEDRHIFLTTLFNNIEYVMEFLTDHHYKNDEEKEWAIRIALRSPDMAAKLYSHYANLLTTKQLQDAFNIAFDKWSAIVILFGSGKLTDTQRIDAIKLLRTSANQCEILIRENILTEKELGLILEYQQENKYVLKTILRYQKNSIDKRKQAFNLYVRNIHDVFDSAKDNHFNSEELQIVHDIFWGGFFEMKKRTYAEYLQYCEIFMPTLNDIELDNLVKRLMAYKRRNDIHKFSTMVPTEYVLKLDGFLVAERLRGKQ